VPCPRCNGTAIDPEHSVADSIDGVAYLEPCMLCQYPNEPHPPSGCRHCGLAEQGHFQRWTRDAHWHFWAAPTLEQIKQRMWSRRTARLNAAPPKYHATTRYTGTPGDPEDEGYALCADCGTDACPQYQRIQTRRAISLTDPTAQYSTGPWGSSPHPF
jgi:hypothetical protein